MSEQQNEVDVTDNTWGINMLKDIEKTLYQKDWKEDLQKVLNKYKRELGVSFKLKAKSKTGGSV